MTVAFPSIPSGTRTLTVAALERLTPTSVHLHFAPLEGMPPYFPGQYVTVLREHGESRLFRSYSLTSVPGLDDHLALAVRRVSGGPVSGWLTQEVQVGDTLQVLPPAGRFFLVPHAKTARHAVLIGGGSGVTPLMGMLRAVLHFEPQSRVTLLYGNRSVDEIMFHDALKALEEAYPSRLRVIHALERPEEGWTGLEGRLDAARLHPFLAALEDLHRAEFYLCGPPGMLEAAETTLRALGVPDDQVRAERFSVAERPKLGGDGGTGSALVNFVLGGQVSSVWVPPDQSLLEAAEAAGFMLDSSCRAGDCGTCKARLTQGAVNMEHAHGLDEAEAAQGWVLTCVAYPQGDLTVELVE